MPPSPTRRDVLAGAAATAIAAPALAQPAPAANATAQAARGTVFEGTDGSGRRGPGIPDALVSNGRDVARTGADGGWTLPVRDGDSLFVIKPTGWMVPTEPGTHLPRFARLHQPDGTPSALGLRYRGVDPTGPLPDSVDFPLRRQLESPRFDALLLTDPQPESEEELGFVRDDVLAQAGGVDAAFGITTGDIMFDDLSLYGRSNRITGTAGRPWWHLCGNHDMNYEAPDNTYSRETFKRTYGIRHYAWQYGGATFVALDNVEYLGGHKYQGRIGPDQILFVRNLLAQIPREGLVVVVMHIPLRTLVGREPNTATVDAHDLLAALGDRPATVSFSGHTHTNEHHYLGAADGFAGAEPHHHHVLSAVSGSWWSGPPDARGIPVAVATDGAPNGFHVLSVDGAVCTTRLIPAHDPDRGQMRLMLDAQYHRGDREVIRAARMGELGGGTLDAAEVYGASLLVNLFDGGPRSRLAFRVGDGDWRPMIPSERIDPYVQELYARYPGAIKPWVHAGRSTHLWEARLPPDLPAGTHRISVHATDEHGRDHDGAMILEIAGA